MSASEASARAAGNVRRGKTAERAVGALFREQGWPGCERAVRTGVRTADRTVADPGDLTGVPFIVSIKDTAREDVVGWFRELAAMRSEDPAALGFVVHKRRGKASAGAWWAWVRLDDLTALVGGRRQDPSPDPVRLELASLVDLLLDAGYGGAA